MALGASQYPGCYCVFYCVFRNILKEQAFMKNETKAQNYKKKKKILPPSLFYS